MIFANRTRRKIKPRDNPDALPETCCDRVEGHPFRAPEVATPAAMFAGAPTHQPSDPRDCRTPAAARPGCRRWPASLERSPMQRHHAGASGSVITRGGNPPRTNGAKSCGKPVRPEMPGVLRASACHHRLASSNADECSLNHAQPTGDVVSGIGSPGSTVPGGWVRRWSAGRCS